MDIESIREFCLALPHTEEDVKWEDHLCFLLARKIYCLTDLKDPYKICLKVSPEDFERFTQFDSVIQAPHFAKRQWVLITDTRSLAPADLEYLLRNSYEQVRSKLPKKIQQELR